VSTPTNNAATPLTLELLKALEHLPMDEKDINARAEQTITLFKNAQAEAETDLRFWTMTAKGSPHSQMEYSSFVLISSLQDSIQK
jgi:hypothetical protein